VKRRFGRLGIVALFLLTENGFVLSQTQAQGQTDSAMTGLGKEFASETVTVNGITLHYVRGGQGSPIILIHGFPEDWFEYHEIMPRLAKRFTVIAVDLRGLGGDAGRLRCGQHGEGRVSAYCDFQNGARLPCRSRRRRDGGVCVCSPLSTSHERGDDPRWAASRNRGVGRDSSRSQRVAHPVHADPGAPRETRRWPAGRLPRLLPPLRQIHTERGGPLCRGVRLACAAPRSV
jgi:alpha/beta hydrolase fold